MVKTISELESRVKNYRGKTKKQNEGSACMHASGWREMEVGGGHVADWLAGLTGASNRGLPIAIGSHELPLVSHSLTLSLSIYAYIYVYICIHIYTYICIHIHIYVYT
jgi:hypothetical protein